MDISTLMVRVDAKVNRRRMRAMSQELIGRLKRARRRDRPAVYDAGVREIVRVCVRVDVAV